MSGVGRQSGLVTVLMRMVVASKTKLCIFHDRMILDGFAALRGQFTCLASHRLSDSPSYFTGYLGQEKR